MHLGEAQRDMRRAYVNGGVGIFASGLVWTLSGLVTMNISLIAGMATLFFGGMAIHPISVLLARSVYRRGKTRSPNPMEMLALQSTAFLIIGLVIASGQQHIQPLVLFHRLVDGCGALSGVPDRVRNAPVSHTWRRFDVYCQHGVLDAGSYASVHCVNHRHNRTAVFCVHPRARKTLSYSASISA